MKPKYTFRTLLIDMIQEFERIFMNNDFILQYEPAIEDGDIIKINEYLKSGGFITEYKKTKDFEKAISNYS